MTTAIRFAGGLSQTDAQALAGDMRTSPDFLMGMHKAQDRTQLACYVRNITPHAATFPVALGRAEREPRMNETSHARLQARVRQQVAAPIEEVMTRIASATTAAPSEPDEFADRY